MERGQARLAAGIAVALVTAGLAWAAGGAVAGLIGLGGAGLAAALALFAPGADPAVPTAGPEPDEVAADAVIEGLTSPALLVRDGRVALANEPARALLGRHIVGEDVRVALRHPAAAEALARGAEAEMVELVGLGMIDQRWLMRVGAAGGGARLIELTDETGHHAAERMRVDFVANASHELRTPLASILGYAETLADGAGEDAALRTRFLQVMTDEARRMQRLVEDLLSLSRIEGDKHRLPTARVDLAGLIARVCDELRRVGPRADDVVCRVAPDLPAVTGDEAQLSQLLHNLVGNAMKYGQAGTPVTVGLDRGERDGVRLTVADRGDGIAPDHIPRLTERFYRVDAGRSRSLGGTGLGLAIVKHIVERHRGRLDVASRVGEGTTVTVTLPPAR